MRVFVSRLGCYADLQQKIGMELGSFWSEVGEFFVGSALVVYVVTGAGVECSSVRRIPPQHGEISTSPAHTSAPPWGESFNSREKSQ